MTGDDDDLGTFPRQFGDDIRHLQFSLRSEGSKLIEGGFEAIAIKLAQNILACLLERFRPCRTRTKIDLSFDMSESTPAVEIGSRLFVRDFTWGGRSARSRFLLRHQCAACARQKEKCRE